MSHVQLHTEDGQQVQPLIERPAIVRKDLMLLILQHLDAIQIMDWRIKRAERQSGPLWDDFSWKDLSDIAASARIIRGLEWRQAYSRTNLSPHHNDQIDHVFTRPLGYDVQLLALDHPTFNIHRDAMGLSVLSAITSPRNEVFCFGQDTHAFLAEAISRVDFARIGNGRIQQILGQLRAANRMDIIALIEQNPTFRIPNRPQQLLMPRPLPPIPSTIEIILYVRATDLAIKVIKTALVLLAFDNLIQDFLSTLRTEACFADNARAFRIVEDMTELYQDIKPVLFSLIFAAVLNN